MTESELKNIIIIWSDAEYYKISLNEFFPTIAPYQTLVMSFVGKINMDRVGGIHYLSIDTYLPFPYFTLFSE
jgi:hypothetical protein